MPLIDLQHLVPRLRRGWEGFHHIWASVITQHLNRSVLPVRYHAEPELHAGASIAADVSTFEHDDSPILPPNGPTNGGVAVAVWAPPAPSHVGEVQIEALDTFEVQVYADDASRALVAAIELVSPSNKDRPSHREAFTSKCAAYLKHGVSVVIVDVITERHANLHLELMALLQQEEAAPLSPTDLYATAYRTAGIGARVRFEAWPVQLSIGQPLPTLPLWLSPSLSVRLDLEATYHQSCQDLRVC